MKKNLLLFVCFISLLINFNFYAHTVSSDVEIKTHTIAVNPPVVTSPVYLCQGSTAARLTATASAGNTLIWYGTNATGGTGSAIAPIPSTTTVGSASYYVSETDGVIESARSRIVVNVVADTNDSIQFINCTYPTPNSIYFDWANIVNHPPNAYNYTYSIEGGPIVSGNENNSSVTISGLLPGQSVTLTITSVVSFPCIPVASKTCSVPCVTLSTPTFDPIGPICAGDTAPPLPATSKEGIKGTWSPIAINNTISGTYTFTPNANECARNQTINVVVNPDTPGFSDFSICSGNSAPTLDTISPNGVTGTWNPTSVDNINSDSYIFTPDAGQCSAPQTIDVTVIPSNTLVSFDWTVTEAFATNQKVTILPMAPGGDYLYQLDDGPFQSSPVFEYVASGQHSATVKDQTGCSVPVTRADIIVVNYPKFFTPNNDGFNDYWNISELSSQPYAYIRIFDRYGKFLKQISPNGAGWNGTFNGHYVPADDYWFVIHYLENNTVKEFKSHFSLKR